MFYIYKITCQTTNKCYIGRTNNPQKRWREHLAAAKTWDYKLYRAIRKYGINKFTFEIIEQTDNEDYLVNILEPQYIKYYDSYHNGFNENLGGYGVLSGLKFTEEHKQKISIANKGKPKSEAHKLALRKPKKQSNANQKANDKKRNTYQITFDNGTTKTISGIVKFAKENNYYHSGLHAVMHGKNKKHKDIIGVKQLDS